MSRIWLMVSCLALLLVVPASEGQPAFDLWTCLHDCEFRYNIERDAWGGGAVILPRDTQRRIAYQDCVDACNKKSWSSFGDQDR